MVLFLDQKRHFNPANMLSKYNLHNDSVELWIERANKVFKPDWLQTHPRNYVKSLFEQSHQAVNKQAEGGYQHTKYNPEVMSNDVNNVCCKLILASDPVTDVKRKFNIPKYEILSSLFNKFQQFPNDIPLRILGSRLNVPPLAKCDSDQ